MLTPDGLSLRRATLRAARYILDDSIGAYSRMTRKNPKTE